MQEYMKTILSALKAWVNKRIKNNTPDWDQSDPNTDGYIKNKPFYTARVKQELVNKTVTLDEDNSYITISNYLQFENNQKYDVTFNGVKYECTAWAADGSVCIGNGNIYGVAGKGEDVPFCCDSYSDGSCYLNVETSGTYEIIIFGAREKVVKIDAKYLPSLNIENGLGIGSVATTYSRTSAPYAFAEGKYASAEGESSHAEGQNTRAVGNISHAEGYMTYAGGYASHAEGEGTRASGTRSHAEGYNSKAIGNFSHAEGSVTYAADSAHAEGSSTIAANSDSHAEGAYTNAMGFTAHAEGYGFTSNARISGAAGGKTYFLSSALTLDKCKTCIGAVVYYSNNTSTSFATIIGCNEDYTVIEVDRTLSEEQAFDNTYVTIRHDGIAAGDYSHNEGFRTIATAEAQHVQGKLNVRDAENKYAHIVGNGAEYGSRSNAHALDWNGNAYYAGDVYVTGDGKNDFAGSKKLATEKAVDEAINAPRDYILLTDQVNGKKYRVFMSDGNLVSEREFDPTTDLVDFEYADNDNGTYTLNSWKGTYKGEPSTEIIVPNQESLIV